MATRRPRKPSLPEGLTWQPGRLDATLEVHVASLAVCAQQVDALRALQASHVLRCDDAKLRISPDGRHLLVTHTTWTESWGRGSADHGSHRVVLYRVTPWEMRWTRDEESTADRGIWGFSDADFAPDSQAVRLSYHPAPGAQAMHVVDLPI